MAKLTKNPSHSSTRFTARPQSSVTRDVEKADGAIMAPAQAPGRSTHSSSRSALGSGTGAGPNPVRSPDDEAEERFQPKSFKFWSVLISLYLGLFLVALDRTIIGTATPQITQEFHSLGDIGWYGSAYQLTTAASQLLFGRVYKFYEIKSTFLITVALFEIGSVICGVAPNSAFFIVGRAIAGFGGAGIFSGVTVIMITMVPLRKRPMFQGLFGMVFGLASVLGPLVGGAFTDAVSWRWCFYINLPIGAVAAMCLVFILDPVKFPHPPATIWEQIRRLDPLGTIFFVPSIVCLLIALQWGGSTYAWRSWRIIILLDVFAALFIAFAAVQVLLPKTATVPVRVIKQRSILAATIFMFSIAGSFLMVIFYLPIWFQVVKGATATQSGIYTLPFVLSLVVASILSGALTQKIGYYVPAMIACPSLIATGQGLMSTFRVDEVPSHWIGFQVISGFGLGLGMQASSLAAQAVLPVPDAPIGIAIMFFAQQLGGGIFTSVGQNLLSTYLVSHLGDIPGISPGNVTGQGAADVVSSVLPEYRLAVKTIYNQAITRIFLCAMGVALVAVIASFFMEWKDLKHTGPRRGSSLGVEAEAPPTGHEEREDSPRPLADPSRLASCNDSHSGFYYTPDSSVATFSAALKAGEASTAVESQMGCEHCEYCRVPRAIAHAASERKAPLPPEPPMPSHQYPRSPFPAEALEEVTRLASVARECVAQLEELIRPFYYLNASTTDGYSMRTLPSRPIPASIPPRDPRRQPRNEEPSKIPYRPREPTTEELLEDVRRLSAQLAREQRENVPEKRSRKGKEKEEPTVILVSKRSSRQGPATSTKSPASEGSQEILNPGRRR